MREKVILRKITPPQRKGNRYIPATYLVVVEGVPVGSLRPVAPANGLDYWHQLYDREENLVPGAVATRGVGRHALDELARNLYGRSQ